MAGVSTAVIVRGHGRRPLGRTGMMQQKCSTWMWVCESQCEPEVLLAFFRGGLLRRTVGAGRRPGGTLRYEYGVVHDREGGTPAAITPCSSVPATLVEHTELTTAAQSARSVFMNATRCKYRHVPTIPSLAGDRSGRYSGGDKSVGVREHTWTTTPN